MALINTQIIADFLFSFSIILLSAISFWIIYFPTKIFHYCHALSFTIGAYTFLFFYNLHNFYFIVALILSIFATSTFGLVTYHLLYDRFIGTKHSNLNTLIVSIGLYTFVKNLFSIYFGNATHYINTHSVAIGFNWLGAYLTYRQIITITTSLSLTVIIYYLWNNTGYGKIIKALSTNPTLAHIHGINKFVFFLLAFSVGSALAAITGILVGYDVGVKPGSGFPILLTGATAIIVGGVNTFSGVVLGSLVISLTETLITFYIGTIWTEPFIYSLLVLFLIIKPFGLKGEKLKKAYI